MVTSACPIVVWSPLPDCLVCQLVPSSGLAGLSACPLFLPAWFLIWSPLPDWLVCRLVPSACPNVVWSPLPPCLVCRLVTSSCLLGLSFGHLFLPAWFVVWSPLPPCLVCRLVTSSSLLGCCQVPSS
ncbi:unnamed protein product [Acanthosepion pharaonis]|uniref:Uncharacterized protein n=1 Tax=Acanthosepion pharaonis TaxID=158019 RepID=A0A812BC31_ACAPH|nr:unnamed protein product [Sepia pharaonis]